MAGYQDAPNARQNGLEWRWYGIQGKGKGNVPAFHLFHLRVRLGADNKQSYSIFTLFQTIIDKMCMNIFRLLVGYMYSTFLTKT